MELLTSTFANTDGNTIIGSWMMLGMLLAIVATSITDMYPATKKPLKYFYDHPYSIGPAFMILGPFFLWFNIRQMGEVTK